MTTNLGFLIFGARGLVDGGGQLGSGETHSEGFKCASESHEKLSVRG